LSNPSPSKIYPNWDFWFENKPSGNPGLFRLKKSFERNLRHFKAQQTYGGTSTCGRVKKLKAEKLAEK
jgi:hypothetical protein